MIYHNSKGKVIGELIGDKFCKTVSKKKHFMRILEAWGLDENVVEKLKGVCNEIRIHDTDSDLYYVAPFEVFLNKGFTKNFEGTQRFLNIKNWDIRKRGGEFIQQRELSKDEAQLSLI